MTKLSLMVSFSAVFWGNSCLCSCFLLWAFWFIENLYGAENSRELAEERERRRAEEEEGEKGEWPTWIRGTGQGESGDRWSCSCGCSAVEQWLGWRKVTLYHCRWRKLLLKLQSRPAAVNSTYTKPREYSSFNILKAAEIWRICPSSFVLAFGFSNKISSTSFHVFMY